ncbi:hypothetical protein MAUB1S_00149 [Mycolicibacterium aubagnense]
MTTLHEAASLSSGEQGLVAVSTVRANGTIQSSLVNAGVLALPATGETLLAFVAVGPVKLANLRARPQITAAFRKGWHWAASKAVPNSPDPMTPNPGWTPKGCGCCSERSSPQPAANTTTGTTTTRRWPNSAEQRCSSAPTRSTATHEDGVARMMKADRPCGWA